MAENLSDLKERLVAGVERGGRRRRFDPQAKRELVQACLLPGVSVAGMALEHGLNANLLRRWISEHVREHSGSVATKQAIENAVPAFVPVIQIGDVEPVTHATRQRPARLEAMQSSQCLSSPSRLVAELPNGVILKFDCNGQDATLMATMIETLARCHVPARC